MPTNADTLLIKRLQGLLEDRATALRALGIRSVELVGSRARGTAKAGSDVDLLLDLAPGSTMGLFDLVTLKDDLADALGCKVDIAFKGSLRPYVAAHMARDARRLL